MTKHTQASSSTDATAYPTYIASAAWRSNPARLREFEQAKFQCRLCPNAAADGYSLEAHHRTYARLGHEIEGDLTALCRECHRGVTSMLRARRYATAVPPPLVDYVPHPTTEPLFDHELPGEIS